MRRPLARLVPAATALLLLGCGETQPIAPDARIMGAAAPGGQLAAPSDVTLVIGSDGTLTVGWRDNSNNETRFDVLRSNGTPSEGFGVVGTAAGNATS